MPRDATLQALLDELYAAGQTNDADEDNRAKKMLNLEPATAQLISTLIQLGKRHQILEIGTSNGYSTIWLATAAQPHGGSVVSIDRDPAKHTLADENLRRAGVRGAVTLHVGDATQIVAELPGPFDCVFFDADRLSAPAQLTALLPKLSPDVLLLHDNALSHPDEIAGYLAMVERLPDFDQIIVPIGKGLSVAYRAG
ncbi:MAG TPA: class I SAM-dependent methyltransferase [Ktedonobacterales bacterium]|nr:class I SAM-dependent methyltransferase [Ktedonobacterales bacterium]